MTIRVTLREVADMLRERTLKPGMDLGEAAVTYNGPYGEETTTDATIDFHIITAPKSEPEPERSGPELLAVSAAAPDDPPF